MRPPALKRYCLIACCCILAAATPPLTATPSDPEQVKRLQQLRQRIKALQRELVETERQRDQTRLALRQVERRIGGLLKNLRILGISLRSDKQGLKKLHQQKQQQSVVLRQNAQLLRKQARSAYVLGRQEYLKLLLNQKEPSKVQRVLIYYRYLNLARNQEIDHIGQQLVRINNLQNRIQQHQGKLQLTQQTQIEEKQTLELAKVQRQQVMTRLNARAQNQKNEIDRLQRDERRLQKLVSRIGDISITLPIPKDLGGRFREQKGKLKLPLRGKLIGRYGAPKYLGRLRWRGLFIATSRGTAVKSVFRGRVAYADWLPGFGLLLILEHGDGYMTLYGHNQSLYKEVGDWVEADQVVAISGNTGNPPRPGLYFEVRYQGRTRDPLRWCRRQ